MRKYFYSLFFISLAMLNSCLSINTSEIKTLDKPIRIGVIITNISSSDQKSAFEKIVNEFANNFNTISGRVKSLTGYPLDRDRFILDAQKGKLFLYSQNIAKHGIVWNADGDPDLYLKTNEVYAVIHLTNRQITINRDSKLKTEKIFLKFGY